MGRPFYESDIQSLVACRPQIEAAINALTYCEELPSEGGAGPAGVKRFKVLESPQSTKLRVAVALGLLPVDALVNTDGKIQDADQLALRIRERMGAGSFSMDLIDLETLYAERRPPLIDAAAIDEMNRPPGPGSQLGARPLEQAAPPPPQEPQGGIAAEPSEEPAPPKGKLPESFGVTVLEGLAACDPPVTTFHQLRKLIASGTDEKPWYKDVKGVGAPTAAKLEEAAKTAAVEEE